MFSTRTGRFRRNYGNKLIWYCAEAWVITAVVVVIETGVDIIIAIPCEMFVEKRVFVCLKKSNRTE